MRKLLHKIRLNQTLFLYLVIALVPLIFVTIFVIRMTTSILTQNSQNLITYQANHVAEVLNDETESLLNVFYSTLSNQELRTLCSRFNKNDNVEYTISQMKETFSFYMTLAPNISQCIFISSDCRYTNIQSYRPLTSNTEWNDDRYREKILKQIVETNSLTLFPANGQDSGYEASPVFYVGIPVNNNVKKYNYGVLIFGIQKSYFKSAFFETENNSQDTRPEILQQGQLILTNQEDTVIYASDSSMRGQTLKNYKEKYGLTEKEYLITKYDINQTNWTFLSYCPKKMAFLSVTTGKTLLYILVFLYSIFLCYTSALIISQQNQKIQKIAEGIQHFKGDEKDYHIPLFSNENLNVIITQFNSMADRVTSLTENLKAEQKKSEMEMNLRRKAEIKILEAQINPHFLYNTLDTINWMAISRNEMEISNMLGALGSLLRYSVTNIDSPVLIKAELEWIKKYLFLQEKRFHALFTYNLEIEPGVENLTIHKMLLQPLIENCIVHGFRDISSGGHIKIQMFTANNNLIITIEDNGGGLSPEKLEELRFMAQNPNSYTGENIGFLNVLSRLHVYFKDKFSFAIESTNGTKISITLPNERSDEQCLIS